MCLSAFCILGFWNALILTERACWSTFFLYGFFPSMMRTYVFCFSSCYVELSSISLRYTLLSGCHFCLLVYLTSSPELPPESSSDEISLSYLLFGS